MRDFIFHKLFSGCEDSIFHENTLWVGQRWNVSEKVLLSVECSGKHSRLRFERFRKAFLGNSGCGKIKSFTKRYPGVERLNISQKHSGGGEIKFSKIVVRS